jgi:Tol biopolymer transport system component
MTDVKNLLRDLDRLEVPVNWADVERHPLSRLPDPPRAHRFVTVIVAFGIFAGAAGLLWVSVGSGDRQQVGGNASSPPRPAVLGGQVLVTVYSPDNADFDIYRMNADGSDLTRVLADPAYRDTYPVLSPDGTQIAFVRSPVPTPDGQGGSVIAAGSDIYVMDADGTHLVQLTDQSEGGVTQDEPAWSPDGTEIAYRSNEAGALDVWVMDADGANARKLTDAGDSNGEPIWSPDGTKIAFDSDRQARSWGLSIWVMNSDGSDPAMLTDTEAGDIVTSWSPDGTKIAFQRSVNQSDYAWDVWVMNADGTGQQKLTNWVGRDGSALWSSDGTQLMFSSDRYIDEQQAQQVADEVGGSGSWPDAVYVMNADGSHVTQILPASARVWLSDWTETR